MDVSNSLRRRFPSSDSRGLEEKDIELEAKDTQTDAEMDVGDTRTGASLHGMNDDFEIEEIDRQLDADIDSLSGIWNEMAFALEYLKDPAVAPQPRENEAMTDEICAVDPQPHENEAVTDEICEHSFILKDDIGEVCRICGFIKRSIETIIEYNFSKGTKRRRRY